MVFVGEREESGWVCVSSMASRAEGTGVMTAGVGGRVPAVGSAPLSLFAGARAELGLFFLSFFLTKFFSGEDPTPVRGGKAVNYETLLI